MAKRLGRCASRPNWGLFAFYAPMGAARRGTVWRPRQAICQAPTGRMLRQFRLVASVAPPGSPPDLSRSRRLFAGCVMATGNAPRLRRSQNSCLHGSSGPAAATLGRRFFDLTWRSLRPCQVFSMLGRLGTRSEDFCCCQLKQPSPSGPRVAGTGPLRGCDSAVSATRKDRGEAPPGSVPRPAARCRRRPARSECWLQRVRRPKRGRQTVAALRHAQLLPPASCLEPMPSPRFPQTSLDAAGCGARAAAALGATADAGSPAAD